MDQAALQRGNCRSLGFSSLHLSCTTCWRFWFFVRPVGNTCGQRRVLGSWLSKAWTFRGSLLEIFPPCNLCEHLEHGSPAWMRSESAKYGQEINNHTIQFCYRLNNPCLIPTKHSCILGLPHDRTHRSLFSDAALAWKLGWFGLNQSAMFINAWYDFQSASQLDLGWAWWQPWWQNWACRLPLICGRGCWFKMFKSLSLNS